MIYNTSEIQDNTIQVKSIQYNTSEIQDNTTQVKSIQYNTSDINKRSKVGLTDGRLQIKVGLNNIITCCNLILTYE